MTSADLNFFLCPLRRDQAGLVLNSTYELAAEQIRTVDDAARWLAWIDQLPVHAVVEAAGREMMGLFELLEVRAVGTPIDDRAFHPDSKRISARALQVVANYLSAGRMYVDSAQSLLSSKFGTDEGQYTDFEESLRREFDSSAEYRFTYHLRNALQHVGGIPLNVVQSVVEKRRVVQLVADRDALIRSYKWPKAVRADLDAGPAEVDVLKHLIGGIESFNRLERGRRERALRAARPSLKTLESTLTDVGVNPAEELAAWAMGNSGDLHLKPIPSIVRLRDLLANDHDALRNLGGEEPTDGKEAESQKQAALAAIYVMETFFIHGHLSATLILDDYIHWGPAASSQLMGGLVGLCGTAMHSVAMVLGNGIEEQLHNYRNYFSRGPSPHPGESRGESTS
ncbi:MAG: hypothetical protein V9G08_02945 [Dermatophilaceae bacterium]